MSAAEAVGRLDINMLGGGGGLGFWFQAWLGGGFAGRGVLANGGCEGVEDET